MADQNPQDDLQAIQKLNDAARKIKEELSKVIVGQEEVIEQVLIAIFSRGHALLMGVPGLAKTLMISTLAQTLHLSFNRIQFTPDLMPSDITGTDVIQEDKATGSRQMQFVKGPLFANVILADEINRTPPKTQAALLEGMQERQVTALGKRYGLPDPFFVLATQNPIEQEGTYSLPEAQLDRFMFLINVGYPTKEEEMDIVKRTTVTQKHQIQPVLNAEDIINLQHIVRRVPVADAMIQYAVNLARWTRHKQPEAPDFIKEWVAWGAGPRAAQNLILGAKARAILRGRNYVSGDDIRSVAHPVLRHRVLVNFAAEAEGLTSDSIVDKLLEVVPRQESEALSDGKLPKVLGSQNTK